MKNQSKVRKLANLSIQILILGGTYGFIYKQVFHKNDIPGMIKNFGADLSRPNFAYGLAIVVLLMIVNWGIEAWKWKFLIGKIEKISFVKSYEAVLTGVSLGSFTPNRLGELFSRVFILQKASHVEGILITILGSISQLLVTVLAGSAAMLIFIPRYMADSALGHGYLFYSLLTLIVSFDLLLMGLFFNVSFLTSLKERILKNGLTRLRKFFRVFAFYHNKEIGVVMLMSLLRYIVFSFQFFILLRLAGIPLPFYCAQLLISLIFFIMAIIPTVALAELGIRGSVSLFVLGLYFAHTDPSYITCNLCIFAASTFLWLINLGIPALLGTFFVFRLQFFRNRK